MTLRDLQEQQKDWVKHNFPDRTAHMPLLGLAEEVGELCHAHLKGEQGIRYTTEQIKVKKKDAIGDILIFLVDYCTANGVDAQEAMEDTWAEVIKRDWIANPTNAHEVSNA